MGWIGSDGWHRIPCYTNHTISNWCGFLLSTMDPWNITCHGYQHNYSLYILVLDWGMLSKEWLVSGTSYLLCSRANTDTRYPYPIFEMASQTQRVALFLGSSVLMTASAALLSLLHRSVNSSGLKSQIKSKRWPDRPIPADRHLLFLTELHGWVFPVSSIGDRQSVKAQVWHSCANNLTLPTKLCPAFTRNGFSPSEFRPPPSVGFNGFLKVVGECFALLYSVFMPRQIYEPHCCCCCCCYPDLGIVMLYSKASLLAGSGWCWCWCWCW